MIWCKRKKTVNRVWEFPHRKKEKLLFLKTRPMCWLAIGFLVVISSFLLGRSYRETEFVSEAETLLLEGRIVKKEYKDFGYGGYWNLTLKQVKILQEERVTRGKNGIWEQNKIQEKNESHLKKGSKPHRRNAIQSEVVRLEGKYLCQISGKENEDFKIGQLILMEGKYQAFELPTNPGQFDAKKYYGSLGILGQFKKGKVIKQGTSFSKLQESLWCVRKQAQDSLKKQLGEENGALISAMLLGEKDGLSQEDKNLYQRNGISHILAISGLHLSLLGMGVFRILKVVLADNRQASCAAIMIMSLYCVFTGNSISTIRATIMFALSLLAEIFGRSYDSLSALGLAAILQLFWNPYVLYNSGFLLSFLAVIGVTFVAPRLQELLKVKHKFGKSLCVSLSASLTTLPVLLSNYGTYPWYSVFLNLLILPAMSVLLFLAVVLVGVSFWAQGSSVWGMDFLRAVKEIVVFGMEGILKYFEICCKVFENTAGQEGFPVAPSKWQIAVYIIMVTLSVSRLIRYFDFGRIMLLLCAVCILTLKVYSGVEITMLDVGQGDCVLIRNSNGNIYLSDCGSSSVSQVGKYRLLPFLKQKGYGRIQGIFLSHLDQDHMNGIIELLKMAEEEKIEVRYLFLPESVVEEETGKMKEKQETVGESGVKERQEAAGDQELVKELEMLAGRNKTKLMYLAQNEVIYDGKMRFYCLYPEGKDTKVPSGNKKSSKTDNRNNKSLVFFMQYLEFEMLFTGDVEAEGEREIVEYLSRKEELIIDALKVAHHGSSGSSCEEFLNAVKPKLALISCGRNNSYGHPHEETLMRLKRAESHVMTTVDSGAISIIIGRKSVKVKQYKK